jgi:hypothetical protein
VVGSGAPRHRRIDRGALLTFWMGGKVGDAGLERFASAKHLESARQRIKATRARRSPP